MAKFKSTNRWVDRPLSAEEAAYIAGFIDGEGSIFFVLEKRTQNRSGYRIAPYFSVAQVRRPVLEWIREKCGGRLWVEDRSNTQYDSQDCWKLLWTPKQMRWLLPQLRPYLIVKARCADLMMEFLSLTTAQANYGKYDGERQWEIYQLVKAENSRGRSDYEPVDIPATVESPRPHIPSKTQGVCSVDGCDKPHYGRGFCRQHYRAEFINQNPSGPRGCAHCGAEITDSRPDQKYCDSKCRMKAYRRRKTA